MVSLTFGLLFRPGEAMRRVTQTPLAWQGLSTAMAITLLGAAASLVASAINMKPLPEWPSFQQRFGFIIGSTIFGFLAWVLAFLLMIWLVHWSSRRKGGQGTFRGLMAGLGFAHIPWAGVIPLFALDPNTFSLSLPLALLFFLILWAWSVWLAVRAVEANYDFPDLFPAVSAFMSSVFPVLLMAGPGWLVIAVAAAIFSVVGFG